MKKLFLLLILILIIYYLNGEKLLILNDIINPNQIAVSADELFVVWDASVYRYSLKTEKLINSIGKKGNGPGEFNVNHSYDMFLNIVPLKKRLFLYTSNKISMMNQNGNPLFEKKLSFFATNVKPIGKYFVIKKFSMKDSKPVHSICIFDENLALIKTLKTKKYNYKPGRFEPIQDYFDFKVNDNNIFIIQGEKEVLLSIYDKNGILKKEIPVKYKPVKLLKKHKALANEFLKGKSWYKRIPQEYKKEVIYPENLPICKNFFIKENWIIFHTFNKKAERTEFKFLSITGKLEKSIYLPVQDFNLMEYAPYCFSKDVYYYIKDNADEEWEVYSEKMNLN